MVSHKAPGKRSAGGGSGRSSQVAGGRALAASLSLVLLAGCETLRAGGRPPDSIAVNFRTDPRTGNTDGPFDPATGRPVQTQIGEDGILRVVIDPVTHAPRLLPADLPKSPAAE
ncbi:hypothetical protein IGS68_15550 [Skermanella sp. TT6]|uniref:Uncharacterized protein n=1 Tax=Skermanella cutis TaxID=2775420 RepID=A0ABX7AZU1_9PROT|nr:hypothetical protein [Skermanella sp. TT6]QQP87516.2 hypothetical protein IGS68_15550 [Skermanella sp. TT6]